jgi:hypothetical protein
MKRVFDLVDELKAFLKKKRLDTDVAYYTSEEWCRRCENVGNAAIFSMTMEGGLNHLLNGHVRDMKTLEQFQKIIKDAGYYYELGYSWSLHFYKEG